MDESQAWAYAWDQDLPAAPGACGPEGKWGCIPVIPRKRAGLAALGVTMMIAIVITTHDTSRLTVVGLPTADCPASGGGVPRVTSLCAHISSQAGHSGV